MSRVRHFLKDTDVSASEQFDILKVARAIKRNRGQFSETLLGMSIGLFFEKPSLRTRVSSHTACSSLGATPISLRADELHFHRGETPQDGIRVLAGYLELLLARVYSHKLLVELAKPSVVPIVNGLCDLYHPLQALADLLTIYEAFNGRLKGLRLTYLGDSNNVSNSLALAGTMAGLQVTLCCPKELSPEDYILKEIANVSLTKDSFFRVEHDPKKAVANADIVYTDVWTSMGEEEEESSRKILLKDYQVNSELLSSAKRDTVVMHCLPAHFNEEITRDVFDSPNSRIIEQAHNRFPTTAAIFLFSLWRERFMEFT
jgi:ornithine carbamoyltransferase